LRISSSSANPERASAAGMATPREIEIKLPVRNARALRRRLKELGFRTVEARHLESNRLFDFPDQRLRRARCLLRLRFEGGRCLATYKGAALPSRAFKVRSEIETRVADGARLRKILESLGLSETFRYDKYRTTFARRRDRGRAHAPVAEWDETPIGTFVELEGPRRWIDAVAAQLGYARRDYITASYAALYFEKCRREGKTAGNMVFGAGR
jgi:adenylate cyclase, class 2